MKLIFPMSSALFLIQRHVAVSEVCERPGRPEPDLPGPHVPPPPPPTPTPASVGQLRVNPCSGTEGASQGANNASCEESLAHRSVSQQPVHLAFCNNGAALMRPLGNTSLAATNSDFFCPKYIYDF